MKIVYKESFVIKLVNQIEYIAQDNPSAARKFQNELINRIKDIPKFPRRYRKSIYFDDDLIRDMIYKEEHILYPMSLETLTESDWRKVKQGEEDIGYAWIKPNGEWLPQAEEEEEGYVETEKIHLDTGYLSKDLINLMLTHLPVDLTLVDENNRVAYYSQGKERIFPRSPGIIGREVQRCHPPESVHIVNKILGEFKAGKKGMAEFWIQLSGRLIYITYFALRSPDGAYKGCLEVSQDVTGIRQLEGERRLLDWE